MEISKRFVPGTPHAPKSQSTHLSDDARCQLSPVLTGCATDGPVRGHEGWLDVVRAPRLPCYRVQRRGRYAQREAEDP